MAVKKQWYEIIAPKVFGETVIGETPAAEPEQLEGRTVKISLADLGKEYSKFFIKMHFKIERVEGNKAFAKFIGHDCTNERIYRMVQRHMRRVDCIQDATTKDGVKTRVKSILILTRRTGTSVKDSVREKLRKVINGFVEKLSLEELVKAIIMDALQKQIREECKKVYPVGAVEIRKTELL
jgi:small subunit ribosomal protein S3Ae